ncbi:hypothetical protein P3T34_007896 [Kitasatospora sp. MAP12-44]|nr:hypothetical protein [Kitasatospora sp. MAP12-44]
MPDQHLIVANHARPSRRHEPSTPGKYLNVSPYRRVVDVSVSRHGAPRASGPYEAPLPQLLAAYAEQVTVRLTCPAVGGLPLRRCLVGPPAYTAELPVIIARISCRVAAVRV